MADGNIDTLYKLHKFAGSDSFGIWNKAFIDFNPKVPSIVNQAWWGNTFNSWLSSVGTPAKAAFGNLTGLLGKGTATLAGHAVQGDLPRMKQAMTAFFAFDDTLEKAFGYMRLVFRKVSTNPQEFKYLSHEILIFLNRKLLLTNTRKYQTAQKNKLKLSEIQLSLEEY